MNWFEWRDAPTARFAVVGDPVVHSRSPYMHRAALASIEEAGEYLAVRIPKEEFAAAMDHLASLGYEGVNVTVPLKELAMAWCADYGDDSDLIGAVNTIRLSDRMGWNTDWEGFRVLLEFAVRRSTKSLPKRALILGAGGAARVVATVCSDIGINVGVWNRTKEKAVAMLEDIRVDAEVLDEPKADGFDVVIDATSAGLSGDAPPVVWDGFEGVAIDLKYGSAARPFLDDAESRGIPVFDGTVMLAAQGASSLHLWTGKPVPMDVMLTALYEH